MAICLHRQRVLKTNVPCVHNSHIHWNTIINVKYSLCFILFRVKCILESVIFKNIHLFLLCVVWSVSFKTYSPSTWSSPKVWTNTDLDKNISDGVMIIIPFLTQQWTQTYSFQGNEQKLALMYPAPSIMSDHLLWYLSLLYSLKYQPIPSNSCDPVNQGFIHLTWTQVDLLFNERWYLPFLNFSAFKTLSLII